MAKTAPLKKKGGKFSIALYYLSSIAVLTYVPPAPSVHSRAAKRASSPSIDTDKSLKDVKPPTESKDSRPSILAVHQSAGVSKKAKSGRKSALSAKAKKRQEKGMDRAEAVMDKKEVKIEKSKGKARTVQNRAKGWEELNKKILLKKAEEEALKKLHDDEMEEDDVEVEDAPTMELMDGETNAQSMPEDEEEEL